MEMSFFKKHEKKIFWLVVACSFVAIALFNFLTPVMSDDYGYAVLARNMHSLKDLIVSEYEQYMTWTGRSVNHLILKTFLMADKWVFNLCNSAMFVVMTLLIYYLVDSGKKYNTKLYLLVNLFVWLFAVEFGETILWETGACNYLWGTTNILIAVSLCKFACDKRETVKKPVLWAIAMFVTGLIGGWSNENTSGGGLLLVLAMLFVVWNTDRKQKEKKFKVWLLATSVGMLTGLAFMVLAPGNKMRAQAALDDYDGIVMYLSRAYKITLAIKENFIVLLLIFLAVFCIVRAQKCAFKELSGSLLYLFVFVATCYALVMAPTPMDRAYFGAGIFLIIAVLKCFTLIQEQETWALAGKQIFLWGLCLHMFFVYVDSIVNVARIYRDYNNRHEYILAQKEAGNTNITVPLLHEGFETKYSFGYTTDLKEEPEYWINVMACQYYEVDSISCVPMEEWTEY